MSSIFKALLSPFRKKPPAKKERAMSMEETSELYYRAEFAAMDSDKSNLMSKDEFIRLMLLMGAPNGRETTEAVWKRLKKGPTDRMTEDEYVKLLTTDSNIRESTKMWRSMFAAFDTDGTGWATQQEVVSSLEDIGITVDKTMRDRIAAMDADNDDRVYYRDYLQMQLSLM